MVEKDYQSNAIRNYWQQTSQLYKGGVMSRKTIKLRRHENINEQLLSYLTRKFQS